MSVRLFGIDPSTGRKPQAFGFLSVGRLDAWGVFTTSWELYHILERLRPDIVLIETQYLGSNVKTLIELVEWPGRCVGIAEYLGIPVVMINVACWKWVMLGKQGKIAGTDPRQKVEDMYSTNVDEDVADAILMTTYYQKMSDIGAV